MKIKKNLSDADMLKGFAEKESFETAVLPEEKRPTPKTEEAGVLVSLPEEVLTKLDKAVLQLRFKLKQQGAGEVKWQVQENGSEIIIKAQAQK